MRPLLKVLIPYLLIGLGIGAVWFIATECLPQAMSGPQPGPSSPVSTVTIIQPRPTVPATISSISPASEPGDAPTVTPVATTPWPAPGLTPPPGYADLQNAARLEETDSRAAEAIRSLPWIRDGIRPGDREAAQSLVHYATVDPDLLWALLKRTWMQADTPEHLTRVLNTLDNIFYLDPDAARLIAAMPFLETLQPPDLLAMESLAHLVYADFSAFRRTMAHPRIRDGISDQEAQIVALLSGINRTNPALIEKVLDASRVSVELREVRLPLAGEVTLSIIRTRPGASRTMDLLEHAVRTAEDLMGQPFPVRYVALLFEDAVGGSHAGTNFGTHAAILPKYDVAGESGEPRAVGRIIAHEVAHYYWNSGEIWLDEGAAEFIGAFAERARTGVPLEPDNYPCGSARGIRELESRDYSQNVAGYVCNYAVGERLFLDLHRALGEDAFRQGFRQLNALVMEPEDGAAAPAGIAEVRRAFAGENGPYGRETAIDVIEHWYSGYGSRQSYGPDSRPVVAELPEVAGWVNRAYVSLEQAGRPVDAFAAADGGDWAWLTLEYSHDYAGPPTELTFEVVEYYEDGFPYRRDTLTVEADRRYSGGVQWLSIGPGPGREWAVGRHWVVVNHEGRKVAQAEFEVAP